MNSNYWRPVFIFLHLLVLKGKSKKEIILTEVLRLFAACSSRTWIFSDLRFLITIGLDYGFRNDDYGFRNDSGGGGG